MDDLFEKLRAETPVNNIRPSKIAQVNDASKNVNDVDFLRKGKKEENENADIANKMCERSKIDVKLDNKQNPQKSGEHNKMKKIKMENRTNERVDKKKVNSPNKLHSLKKCVVRIARLNMNIEKYMPVPQKDRKKSRKGTPIPVKITKSPQSQRIKANNSPEKRDDKRRKGSPKTPNNEKDKKKKEGMDSDRKKHGNRVVTSSTPVSKRSCTPEQKKKVTSANKKSPVKSNGTPPKNNDKKRRMDKVKVNMANYTLEKPSDNKSTKSLKRKRDFESQERQVKKPKIEIKIFSSPLRTNKKKNVKHSKKNEKTKIENIEKLSNGKMALYKQIFGKRFFQLKVRVERCKQLSSARSSQKNKKNLSVSFLEEVKVISDDILKTDKNASAKAVPTENPVEVNTEESKSCQTDANANDSSNKLVDEVDKKENRDDESMTLKFDDSSSNHASLEDISSDDLPSSEIFSETINKSHVNGFDLSEEVKDKDLENKEETCMNREESEEHVPNEMDLNNPLEEDVPEENESFKSACFNDTDDKESESNKLSVPLDDINSVSNIFEPQDGIIPEDTEMESLIDINTENNADVGALVDEVDDNDDEVASKLLMPEDVTGLLDGMDTASEKLSPLEVDKLNATIALIDDSNSATAELNLDDGTLGVDRTEAKSIVDSIVNETIIKI